MTQGKGCASQETCLSQSDDEAGTISQASVEEAVKLALGWFERD